MIVSVPSPSALPAVGLSLSRAARGRGCRVRASLAVVLFLYAPASAEPLTWQDCVRWAAMHNPDLQSALFAQEASQAQYHGSYNGILPKLSLSNAYNNNSSNSKFWTAQGTASLDLVDFGRWANIQSASAALRQSQANFKVAASNVLLNLYKAFASLLYAQEEVYVYTNIRDTWKMNADMINLRYKSGSESKGNNMNTQAQLLQAEAIGELAADVDGVERARPILLAKSCQHLTVDVTQLPKFFAA